jgi:phosphomannomutase
MIDPNLKHEDQNTTPRKRRELIRDLMAHSGVAFGTSGARGLVRAMTDRVCCAYTQAFLQYLQAQGERKKQGDAIAVAGDLRPSTGRILEAVSRAAEAMGCQVVSCGRIPSPAVALFGLEHQIPAIMITGSHIPDDRNGIKFNKASGEILKEDEQGITSQEVELDESWFDDMGAFLQPAAGVRPESPEAVDRYIARYVRAFGHDALQGLRIGVYQHSAVGRDLLVTVLSALGAQTMAIGRADTFVPVDTEAIRLEDIEFARMWAQRERFDAIVSTDGDSDRPLVSDEQGRWLRGDVAGILCARFLGADAVCTPVSCNTAVEKCGWFQSVHRTRIGSPYVVAAMNQATAAGAKRVVGYEANGGFLLNSDVQLGARQLRALPTRDALIVIVSVLLLARQEGKPVSELVASLPLRFTASDRLKSFPTEKSHAILARFSSGNAAADTMAIESLLGSISGGVATVDHTDGVRVTFANDEIIHLRPSGNAPELRVYSEASDAGRAQEITRVVLDLLRAL